jgi:hypothetical protein
MLHICTFCDSKCTITKSHASQLVTLGIKKVKKTYNERQNTLFPKPHVAKSIQKASVGDRAILVRIRTRIPGSVLLTSGSGSGSNSDPTPFSH